MRLRFRIVQQSLINVYLTKSIGLTITMLILIAMFAVGAGILSGIFSVNEKKRSKIILQKYTVLHHL